MKMGSINTRIDMSYQNLRKEVKEKYNGSVPNSKKKSLTQIDKLIVKEFRNYLFSGKKAFSPIYAALGIFILGAAFLLVGGASFFIEEEIAGPLDLATLKVSNDTDYGEFDDLIHSEIEGSIEERQSYQLDFNTLYIITFFGVIGWYVYLAYTTPRKSILEFLTNVGLLSYLYLYLMAHLFIVVLKWFSEDFIARIFPAVSSNATFFAVVLEYWWGVFLLVFLGLYLVNQLK